MDVDVHLQRIHSRGPVSADAATLRALHVAHLETVPFENLDIHFDRPILLDAEALFDYAEMCHFHQTSPESPFTRRRVCSQMTTDGRITLSDLRLIVTKRGVREGRLLTEAKWRQVLEDTFGMDAVLFALSPP